MKTIGILIAGHVPEEMVGTHGDYDAIFSALLADDKLKFKAFAVVDGKFPESVDEADGWLITGSRYGAYEDHAWIPPLENLIREIDKSGKPLIGVCFGHQIIAQALGGKVEKFKGGWAAGPHSYMRHDLGREQQIFAWHQDQVVEKPEGAEVIGSSPFCENAVLRYGSNILTYQAHPEFTPGFTLDLFKIRGGALPEEIASNVARAPETKVDRDHLVAEMKAHFLKAE